MERKENLSPVENLVLQSFNMFDPDVSSNLKNVSSRLMDIRNPKADLSKYILTETTQRESKCQYNSSESAAENYFQIAGSIGVKGKYAMLSGSLTAKAKHETTTTATSFFAAQRAFLNFGQAYFNATLTKEVLSEVLSTQFWEAFAKVDSLQAARTFFDQFGTHIALGWGLGGDLAIAVKSELKTIEEKTELSATVEGVYKGLRTIEATIQAAADLQSQHHSATFSQEITAVGGDPRAAQEIKIDDSASVEPWLQSVDADSSSYGLTNVTSFRELALTLGMNDVAEQLGNYENLVILYESLANPSIFFGVKKIEKFVYTTAEAKAPSALDEGGGQFKLLCGGGTMGHAANSYLIESYPHTGIGGRVDSRAATSHDYETQAPDETESLTTYVIAVNDPGDFLKVTVQSSAPTPKNSDTLSVGEGVLVGGGCRQGKGKESYPLTYNAPTYSKEYQQEVREWTVARRAVPTSSATDDDMEVFTVSASCDFIELVQQPTATLNTAPAFDVWLSLTSNFPVLGGGYLLFGADGKVPSDSANFIFQSYPIKEGWLGFHHQTPRKREQAIDNVVVLGFKYKTKGGFEMPSTLATFIEG